jgi:ParB-like chromosome segregation protein Spo0J
MTVRFSKSLTPLLVPIDQVKPHPDNPNKGDDEVVLESVIVNGFVTACTADARTGHMIAGHTRLRVLQRLGATHIPIIWEDDWDETGAKRYLVGDNASARKAVMDDAALLEILKELHDVSPLGLTGTSITEAEYEAMLLEDALEAPPEGVGFGGNPAPAGLHQVIVEFQDDPDSRDEAFAELAQRYENVRTADL